MVNKDQPNLSAGAFWQKMVLPEEDRRNQLSPPAWNGSYRWFRSPNIIDLWACRSALEKQRIIEFMWRQQLQWREIPQVY